jgi:hypothetical protein
MTDDFSNKLETLDLQMVMDEFPEERFVFVYTCGENRKKKGILHAEDRGCQIWRFRVLTFFSLGLYDTLLLIYGARLLEIFDTFDKDLTLHLAFIHVL